MKLFHPVIGAIALVAAPFAALAEDAKPSAAALFQENCAVCHAERGAVDERVAPPIVAVKAHYMPHYPEKAAFVEAMVAWVKAPKAEKVLMPGAVRKFDLMPAMDLEDETLREIAAFIYDGQFEAPGWFREHYRQEHGEYPTH